MSLPPPANGSGTAGHYLTIDEAFSPHSEYDRDNAFVTDRHERDRIRQCVYQRDILERQRMADKPLMLTEKSKWKDEFQTISSDIVSKTNEVLLKTLNFAKTSKDLLEFHQQLFCYMHFFRYKMSIIYSYFIDFLLKMWGHFNVHLIPKVCLLQN